MGTKKVKYDKEAISQLPNNKPALYRIETESGTLNYPLRKVRLKEISEAFQMSMYSSVTSVVGRLNAMLATNRRLRQRVEGLIRITDRSQEQR